jgi:tRNA-binding EMAP/Myf-like protein
MAKLETKKIKTGLVKSIDWNQKCPVTGRYAVKIDKSRTFNDYFGIIRDEPFVTQTDNDVAPKVTAAGSPTTKIALPAKKKVIGKPTKIKGSASEGIVLSTSELKPLDKTKPGYFVEKESGVTQMDGYRNADKDLHGEVRNYDALTEGVIESIYNYFNGKREGLAVLYDYYTGLIKESGSYKNGEKNGEWKRYKNGVVVGTDTYINGVKQ